MSREVLEKKTGQLFGELWGPYEQQLFDESVALFRRRLDIVGFDTGFLIGKTVLDAGCGGGRNTIAMAQLGAAEAQGIDLGAEGIINARKRSKSLANTNFQQASILDIPFEHGKFDLVWCAGVMMITDDEDRALDELTRVLKPDGLLYLLVYADEGMRWPLINSVRPIAARLGRVAVKAAMNASGMPANKQGTFLDDLFCPKLDFYNWDRLRRMLEKRGYTGIQRWDEAARLDHEHSLRDYREDLESLESMFAQGTGIDSELNELYRQGQVLVRGVIDTVAWFENEVAEKRTTEAEAMEIVIGQGHHRVLSRKSV